MSGSVLSATGYPWVALPPPLDARPARWLLLGLGFATGMEFYTYDEVNLVLPDFAGSLGLSDDGTTTTYGCSWGCRCRSGSRAMSATSTSDRQRSAVRP